jgi:hypothetical protein
MSDATEEYSFEYASGKGRVRLSASEITRFLVALLTAKKLQIGDHLDQFMKSESFFLIAGTGLGKTVAIPAFLLQREMRNERFVKFEHAGTVPAGRSPRIWVVEPKIAITQTLEDKLNQEWSTITAQNSRRPIFGCKTRSDHRNISAPIMFVTTGIFAIYARKDVFQPGRDIVLMDEAHVTLEADEAVELGIAICRAREIEINYMSATVDPEGLSKQLGTRIVNIPGKRFPVWRHNTQRPLEECVVELVGKTLVDGDIKSEYFPRANNDTNRAVLKAVTETNRAKGMLIIVNSFSSERSDAKRIARLLERAPFASKIEVGLLASEVLRNRSRRAKYEAMLKRWSAKKCRYVLIATSVVEMGVTLPDLDFIVTMDSGFGAVDDASMRLTREPLGTNALIQRIGRVGRVRPGIAYITREIGAPYSNLSDKELNDPQALEPEKIQFPLKEGDMTWVAYHALEQGWCRKEGKKDILSRILRELPLPSTKARALSKKEDSIRWATRMNDALNKLIKLDVIGEGDIDWKSMTPEEEQRRWLSLPMKLTDTGKLMEYWIGRMDLRAAMAAHEEYAEGNGVNAAGSLCSGVLRAFPPKTLWNIDALKRNFPHLAKHKNFVRLRALIGNLINATGEYGTKSTAGQARLFEHISTHLHLLEANEQRFFLMLMHLEEALAVFIKVARAKQAPNPIILDDFEKDRIAIKNLLKLRSFS